MTIHREVVIGNARLLLGDCMEILPTLPKVDAVITDPPYSARTHAGHDATHAIRATLRYSALDAAQCKELAAAFTRCCDGWIVWMTDHILIPAISLELNKLGRYVFAPMPFFQAGRSVRLRGDGPCSWTDWIVVSRTKAQLKWGTLPGGYVAGSGWNDKAKIGGKPTLLMDALVSHYSRLGDTVLDSHMGAGTTGVSCARTGRKFIGCEIDPAAFDMACCRIDEAQKQAPLFSPDQPVKPQQMVLE